MKYKVALLTIYRNKIEVNLFSSKFHIVQKNEVSVPASVVGPIQDPLDKDHKNQISKQAQKEEQLWQKLQDNLVVLPLQQLVPEAHHDAEGHVDDAENQGNLHLVRV